MLLPIFFKKNGSLLYLCCGMIGELFHISSHVYCLSNLPDLLQILEGNARKVGKVLFKPISSECVGVDDKGVNRLISKKIVKRKKKDSGDPYNSDNVECPDITGNGCPAEVLSYSDDTSAELEDASSSSAKR